MLEIISFLWYYFYAKQKIKMSDIALVPIRETPLPEVRTSAELNSVLNQIYQDGLPGFVIRASGIIDRGAKSHQEVAQLVATSLPRTVEKAGPHEISPEVFTPFATSKGPGELHHDVSIQSDMAKIRVHQTKRGEGKVTLANSGKVLSNFYATTEGHGVPEGIHQSDLDDIDQHFAAGQLDQRIVDPTVYSANLKENDMVIFPVGLAPSVSHDKSGPVWHKFDTTTASREAEITALRPKSS